MNAIVVGRHAPDFGNYKVNIVGQSNVTFPATARETVSVLMQLEHEAELAGADFILLQNTPSQVAVAMLSFVPQASKRWGVIISKPVSAGTVEDKEFVFVADPTGLYPEESAAAYAALAMTAVKTANPMAKVGVEGGTLTLTVDPPRDYAFELIEWFN